MTLVIALNVAFWWPLIGLLLGPLPSCGDWNIPFSLQ